MKDSKELHLRDFGYNIKYPTRFRHRAIKKACKIFSQEKVIKHMVKIAQYHEIIKEDLNIIPLYKRQKEIQRASDEIEAAYMLFNSLNQRTQSPFEKEVLSSNNNLYDINQQSLLLPLPLPQQQKLPQLPQQSHFLNLNSEIIIPSQDSNFYNV